MKGYLFITKIGIALLPFIIIDVLLIILGFSYSAKNETLLKHLADQPIHKNTIRIAFLGTSRTNLGISPDHIRAGTGLSERSIQIVNLGMDGVSSAAVLPLVKNVRVPFDYFFIEILPVEDLLNDTNVFMSPVKPYQEWDNWLTFLISKEFILTKSWELSMFWAGRSPIYFMKCHNNGWTEVKAGKNPLAIEKAKEKWIGFAHTTFRNQPHKKDILNFCAYVKKIFAQDTGRVHFLILPVNGPVRQYQDYVIRSSHLVSILKQEFPQSLLIDANSTYQLSDCRTFEYSHLDSKNAAEFSFKIGEMIRDSLLTNGARNN